MATFEDIFKKITAKVQPEPEPLYWVDPRPMCADCRENEVMLTGDICEDCKTEHERGYKVMYKMGRLANGFALDAGTVYHAVESSMPDYGCGKALCGTSTGRRSAGWHKQRGQAVTCKACLNKIHHKATNNSLAATLEAALNGTATRADVIKAIDDELVHI